MKQHQPILYVIAQFSLISVIAFYCGIIGGYLSSLLFVIALIIGFRAIAAMRFKVSIFPTASRPHAILNTGGPYKYVRHPMYTSVLLATGSWVLSRPDYVSITLYLTLVTTLIFKSRFEESNLLQTFPGYTDHMSKTNKFILYIY